MPIKEDLAQWVACGLRRALTVHNVSKGFSTTGIYPFNAAAMNSKMGPSEAYARAGGEDDSTDTEDEAPPFQRQSQLEDWEIKEIYEEDPLDIPTCTQYYVNIDGSDTEDVQHREGEPAEGTHGEGSQETEVQAAEGAHGEGSQQREVQPAEGAHGEGKKSRGHEAREAPQREGRKSTHAMENESTVDGRRHNCRDIQGQTGHTDNGFAEFLQLPVVHLPRRSSNRAEPLIDYQQSIVLTEDRHVRQL